MPPSQSRPFRADLASALLLAAAPFLLFHEALGLFWHSDDFFNLRFSQAHSPWQILASAETWRELPFKMVTPLMFHSFQLDLALAGASTRAFYLHQLLALSACAAALYLVLRLWLPRAASFAGAILFLCGAPTCGLAVTVMVRHYPEAIALGLASIGTYVLALRRERHARSLTLLSALLYAVACLAKEIAVPLPFGLLLLAERDLRTRLRLAAPHFGVLALYFLYRHHLLSTFAGGYGWAVELGDWLRLAFELPLKMGREMAGGGGPGWLALGLVLGAALFAIRTPGSAGRWLAALGLLLLTVLPVSTEMKSRLAAAPWLLLTAAASCGLARLAVLLGEGRGPQEGREGRRLFGPSRLVLATGLGLALAVALTGGVAGNETASEAARASAENRAYLRLGAGDLLFRPAEYPAAMAELRLFRSALRGADPAADWAYDEIALCPASGNRRIWEYDESLGRVVERSRELPATCSAWRARLRPGAPLSATFRSSAESLTWRLGPYAEGDYALAFEGARGLIALPPAGGYQQPPPRLEFRLRYESPEGWVTYSPLLVWDSALRPELSWRRGPAAPREPGHRGAPGVPPERPGGPPRGGTSPRRP